nr:MAG TPA: hypothetical protein [Caudoviricetes sp.]
MNMEKIDFKQFKFFTDITREEISLVDVRKPLADTLYKNANGIVAHDLALRIYRSNGEIELEDSDVRLLRDLANTLTPIFMDSLEENLKK